jgi:hypothetical protein
VRGGLPPLIEVQEDPLNVLSHLFFSLLAHGVNQRLNSQNGEWYNPFIGCGILLIIERFRPPSHSKKRVVRKIAVRL